jgi:hypothetical protein
MPLNPVLREIGRLARHARCEIDLRSDGRIVLKRNKVAVTGLLQPVAALAWLRRENGRTMSGRRPR